MPEIKNPDGVSRYRIQGHVDRPRFEKAPVSAIARFLECFDSKGCRICDVPEHVLEELAKRFMAFMNKDARTLDSVFGGRTGRQRDAINMGDRDFGILFDLFIAYDEARIEPKGKHSLGPPLERAIARVAEEHKMSEDNVRRIWKESKKR